MNSFTSRPQSSFGCRLVLVFCASLLTIFLLGGNLQAEGVDLRYCQFDGTVGGQTFPVTSDSCDIYIEVTSSKMSQPGGYGITKEGLGGVGAFFVNDDGTIAGASPNPNKLKLHIGHESTHGSLFQIPDQTSSTSANYTVTGPEGYVRTKNFTFNTKATGDHFQFNTGVWMTSSYMTTVASEKIWTLGLEDRPSCSKCRSCGMASYSLDTARAKFSVTDTPLFYSVPRGVGIDVTVNYRLGDPSQEDDLKYSNFGKYWNSNLVSYMMGGPPANQENAYLYLPTGGREEFTGWVKDNNHAVQPLLNTLSPGQYSHATPRWDGAAYQLASPDGSRQVFGWPTSQAILSASTS